MSNNPWANFVTARVGALILESQAMNEIFGHETIKGNIRELFVKRILEPFLPPSIGIGTGEIINHEGRRSRQLDVVLYNKHRVPPILVSKIDTGIFPWECVIAVVEVKSTITTQALYDAHINSNSVYSVYRYFDEDDVRISGVRPKENMQHMTEIPYCLFGFSSDLTATAPADLVDVDVGKSISRLGKEGTRLIRSFSDLQSKRSGLERIIFNVDSTADQIREAKIKYSKLGGPEAELNGQKILSLCVAGREWCTGNVSFKNNIYPVYGNDPVRTGVFNYAWTGEVTSKFNEVLKLLHQIIELAHEMPRCREHYNIARYLA